MIKLTSVSREYPKKGYALQDIDLHVRKAEFVFLTGHSGAGKSTLLRLIQMLERPSSGEIRVSGFSSARTQRGDLPKLRRKIGVVFQDFRLLPDRTAEENVAFALRVTGARRSAIAPRVSRLLAGLGLASRGKALPEELSGGEQQRVAIARALANEPLVLLADEPTGNLDAEAARGVFEIIRELNASGMTVVFATHDLELIERNPGYRTIELAEGRIVGDFAPARPALL